ncbi:membrane protein [Microbispora amethystogenes]|nr:membrane protein [Microbispora amethystogenes]
MSQVSEPVPSPEVLDLYKLAVEMADRVSARRGASNSFFLSVQTAFVAVLGLAASAVTKSLWASVAVALAGITLSAAWWLQLKSYRDLNRAKYEVINKIEEQFSVKIFSDEWTALKRDPVRSWRARYAELGVSERRVPFVFMALHILLFLGRLLG